MFFKNQFKLNNMKKKIQFDYEYFKAHPETELVTRKGIKLFFLSCSRCVELDYPLFFEYNDGNYFTATLGGKANTHENSHDVFMLIDAPEPKVEEWFLNIYDFVWNACPQNSIEKCKTLVADNTLKCNSIFKLVIVDGIVDKEKSETVHIY